MWTVADLLLFQKTLFRVVVPILVVFGNIGSILNVMVFSLSPKLRSSPCSLYLISASIGFGVYLNVVSIWRLFQLGYNIDQSSQWAWLCKLRYFLVGFLLMLPRSYMVLASIDRYLTSRSSQHRFLSRNIAVKLIVLTCAFWMIICLHNVIFYNIQVTSNGTVHTCSNPPGAYSTFLSFYSIIVNGLSMPVLMTIFGLLTLCQLKRHGNQIGTNISAQVERRKRRDWSILQMLLIQLCCNVILSLPVTIYFLYSGLTQYMIKSSTRTSVESSIYNLCTLLQYTNAACSFYLYSLTSQTFRVELSTMFARYSTRLGRFVGEQSIVAMARFGHSMELQQR